MVAGRPARDRSACETRHALPPWTRCPRARMQRRGRSRYRRDSTRSATLALGGRRAELSRLSTVVHASWTDSVPPAVAADATAALEGGRVLFLPHLRFVIGRDELAIFSPSILSS